MFSGVRNSAVIGRMVKIGLLMDISNLDQSVIYCIDTICPEIAILVGMTNSYLPNRDSYLPSNFWVIFRFDTNLCVFMFLVYHARWQED